MKVLQGKLEGVALRHAIELAEGNQAKAARWLGHLPTHHARKAPPPRPPSQARRVVPALRATNTFFGAMQWVAAAVPSGGAPEAPSKFPPIATALSYRARNARKAPPPRPPPQARRVVPALRATNTFFGAMQWVAAAVPSGGAPEGAFKISSNRHCSKLSCTQIG